mmetsp:Transcript_6159/g.8813  ORF Transcript_6159/g.8813 Transcript_6159/m.8813 type:complete len:113 (-) Transcript_6159:202-540(-)
MMDLVSTFECAPQSVAIYAFSQSKSQNHTASSRDSLAIMIMTASFAISFVAGFSLGGKNDVDENSPKNFQNEQDNTSFELRSSLCTGCRTDRQDLRLSVLYCRLSDCTSRYS